MKHFNSLHFWEAHEAWEELWLKAESEAHQFLQGLIQIAAAYHHLKRGTFPGAVRLFDAGLAKVEPFPALYCGIIREGLVRTAGEHRSWAAEQLQGHRSERLEPGDYPRIQLIDDWRSRVPPSEKW